MKNVMSFLFLSVVLTTSLCFSSGKKLPAAQEECVMIVEDRFGGFECYMQHAPSCDGNCMNHGNQAQTSPRLPEHSNTNPPQPKTCVSRFLACLRRK